MSETAGGSGEGAGAPGDDVALSSSGLRAMRDEVELIHEALAEETRRARDATNRADADLAGRGFALAAALQATQEFWAARREKLRGDLVTFGENLELTAQDAWEVETASSAAFVALLPTTSVETGWST